MLQLINGRFPNINAINKCYPHMISPRSTFKTCSMTAFLSSFPLLSGSSSRQIRKFTCCHPLLRCKPLLAFLLASRSAAPSPILLVHASSRTNSSSQKRPIPNRDP
ncbi:unnamed protein product, partial [Amoebophrya sp. A25]|eukprot:GSA25T00020465001.1